MLPRPFLRRRGPRARRAPERVGGRPHQHGAVPQAASSATPKSWGPTYLKGGLFLGTDFQFTTQFGVVGLVDESEVRMLAEIRKQFGVTPREHERALGVRPSVSAVIFDRRRRLLLQQRSDGGQWGLPGGSVEIGESLVEVLPGLAVVAGHKHSRAESRQEQEPEAAVLRDAAFGDVEVRHHLEPADQSALDVLRRRRHRLVQHTVDAEADAPADGVAQAARPLLVAEGATRRGGEVAPSLIPLTLPQ